MFFVVQLLRDLFHQSARQYLFIISVVSVTKYLFLLCNTSRVWRTGGGCSFIITPGLYSFWLHISWWFIAKQSLRNMVQLIFYDRFAPNKVRWWTIPPDCWSTCSSCRITQNWRVRTWLRLIFFITRVELFDPTHHLCTVQPLIPLHPIKENVPNCVLLGLNKNMSGAATPICATKLRKWKKNFLCVEIFV